MHRAKHMIWVAGLALLVVACYLPVSVTGQNTTTQRADSPEPKPTPEEFTKLHDAFMNAEWDDMATLVRRARAKIGMLTPKQRKELMYISREWSKIKPKWWKHTSSSRPVAFPAEIWAKRFKADYLPSEYLGAQIPVTIDPYTNRVRVIVTWHPDKLDSEAPLRGKVARRHGIEIRHMAECIVWHELGHNYITNSIPTEQVLDLYVNHRALYGNCQEFYADMTALRHGSPKAALMQLLIRIEGLIDYNTMIPHTRAAHGVGAILLVEWMNHPDKWPMIHFPPEVPKKDVELNTLLYIYYNLDPDWDVTQYNQLRTYVDNWIRKGGRGDAVLKQRGRIKLDNRLEMYLEKSKDRQWQEKRDAWVAKRLEQLIKSGRADPKKREEGDEWHPTPRKDGVILPIKED